MLTTHNIDIQAMLVWLTLPFYDFCGFRSVAVNSVYKLQFFTFISINDRLLRFVTSPSFFLSWPCLCVSAAVTVQDTSWYKTSVRSNLEKGRIADCDLDLHVTHCSCDPHESAHSHPLKQDVDRFSRFCRPHERDQQTERQTRTDKPRLSVCCSGSLHLMHAMWHNNIP